MGKFPYKLFSKLSLCYAHFSGYTTIDDIYDFVNSLIHDETYLPTFSSIIDFRDADLFFKKFDGIKYVEFVNVNPQLQGDRRVAFLTTTPQQTAHSIEYKMLAEGLPMHVRVFTTIEACFSWAGIAFKHIEAINNFILSQKNS